MLNMAGRNPENRILQEKFTLEEERLQILKRAQHLEGSGIIQSYKRCKSLVRSSEQNAVACVEVAVL
jgi:hypothetical protein